MIEKIISGYCVLNIHSDVIYAAKGYKIYKSFDEAKNWEFDGVVDDFKFTFLSKIRLSARLFRAEITDLLVLQDGSRILIGKKGIFVAKKNSKNYKKTFEIPRGTRPLNICEDLSSGIIYFGEYLSNPEREPVNIYYSKDGGSTWNVCYTFAKNTIRHVHGIFYDKFEKKIWFATGDLDRECIIGYTSDGFKTVEIFKKDKQKYRTVQIFFYKYYIVYGTDTEYERNFIYQISRKDKNEKKLMNLEGSVLSGSGDENGGILSTAVEPSEVNNDIFSHVMYSENGIHWIELCAFEKDDYSKKYFQYGRVKFPRNAILNNKLYLSGHALKGIDGNSVVFNLDKVAGDE